MVPVGVWIKGNVARLAALSFDRGLFLTSYLHTYFQGVFYIACLT